MSLNARQTSLYKHRLDLWRTSRTITAGKPGDETYTLVQSSVPCIYNYTPNVDSETSAGRVKEFTLLTTDKIFMEANVPIQDNYLTVNTTITAAGTRSAVYGEVHRVLGGPTVRESLGHRKCNDLFVEGMTMEHPPETIRSYYSL